MSVDLRGALEDNILTILCWNEQFAHTVAMQLEPRIFSTVAYQKIATHAITHLERFRRPPGIHIRDLLESELERSGGDFYCQIFQAMEEIKDHIQPDAVQYDLERFLSKRQLETAIIRASDALENGDLEKAQEAFSLGNANNKQQVRGAWLHDTPKWLSFLSKEETDFISSGVDVLDERGVHPGRKELYLFIGPPKSGKSWHLINIGKVAVERNRMNVLHVSLENSSEVTQQRYTQAFLGLAVNDAGSLRVPLFEKNDLGKFTLIDFEQVTPDQLFKLTRADLSNQIKRYQKRGKLLVQEFPTGALTIAQLHNFLDMLERQDNFKPDLIILDYADLMTTDEGNLRISTGRVFRDLRGLAVRRNVAVVTATQGNRASATAKTLTANMVSEDWSKIGTADTVVTYSQTKQERGIGTGLARLLVAAARNARDQWEAQISQSYQTGQFCLDSVYMNNDVKSEIERHLGEDE